MARVSYSSPAAAALSVLSMPPTTVASENGSAMGKYAQAAERPPTNARVGQGTAICNPTEPEAAPAAMGLAKCAACNKWCAANPSSAETKAPGRPHGIRTFPTSATRMTANPSRPGIGSAVTFNMGSNAIRANPAPPIEPSKAARGTAARTAFPANDRAILKTPNSTVTAMPIFHVSRASPVRAYAGPRTPKDMPKMLGAFIPSGMAVTSSRPVRRASRNAMSA